MTKKAMKLMLAVQVKSGLWFLFTYALIVGILSVVFHYIQNIDTEWMGISTMYAPKIYLLVMGIVYPLITLELYISRGLTRRQYFLAFMGTMSILALVFLIPTLIAQICLGTITPFSVILNYVQMPMFFLAGWSAGTGFHFRKWYAPFLGILSAVACFQIMNLAAVLLNWPDIAQLGIALLLLAAQLILLPRIISRIPIKC